MTLDQIVEKFLKSKDFFPEETEDKRRELAVSIAKVEMADENNGEVDDAEELVDVDAGMVFDQVNSGRFEIKVEATENGELLRFRNAILAQAETNKNSDSISNENIQQLASTLAGRAIDINHDERANSGVITAAKAVLYKGNPAVSIDGLGWRDRYPEEWDGVRAGTHHLSVEADADKAICSVCKGEFETPKLYCEHLKNRRSSGAKRGFAKLTGKGAGITTRPAGTDTHFDREQIFVVAHQEDLEPELEASWYDSELPQGETLADLPASDFADPKGRRFPYKIHGKVNKRGWLAAWSAAHGGHTGVKDKGAIEKLLRDKPADVNVEANQEDKPMDKCPRCNADIQADISTCTACGKSVQATAILAELKASETALATKAQELATALAELEALRPAAEKAEEATKSKAEVEASLADANTKLADAQSKVDTTTAELILAQKKLTDIRNVQRESELKPFLSDGAWTERSAAFLAMEDDLFTTVAASIKDAAKKPAPAIGLRSGMPDPVAGSDNGHSKISLR